MEQAEEIGEGLHAQAAHVVQFRVAETQAAQVVDLFVDLVDVMGQVDAGRAALEPVLHLGTGCWWSTACIMVNLYRSVSSRDWMIGMRRIMARTGEPVAAGTLGSPRG